NCSAADIAILHSTTEGLSLVAQGLDWEAGDEVISYELEHPNAVYPWKNLADRGVVIRYIKDAGYRFDADQVAELITDRTRVVCLSLVNFGHGFRSPVERISAMCKPRGIWVVIDAVQAVGSISVDVAALGADIVSAHAYKWLLGG